MFVARSLSCFLKVIFFAALIFGFSACPAKKVAPPPPPPPAQPVEKADLEHVVKYKGETLSIIANWYTGKTGNWGAIQKANNGLKPEKIRIGDRIKIPAGLVVKGDTLPESYVKGYLAKAALKEDLQKELNSFDNPVPVSSTETTDVPAGTVGSTGAITGTEPTTPSQGTSPAGVLPDDLAPNASPEDNSQPTPPVAGSETPPVAAPEVAASPESSAKNPEDAERERLLDELLSQ